MAIEMLINIINALSLNINLTSVPLLVFQSILLSTWLAFKINQIFCRRLFMGPFLCRNKMGQNESKTSSKICDPLPPHLSINPLKNLKSILFKILNLSNRKTFHFCAWQHWVAEINCFVYIGLQLELPHSKRREL